MHVAAMVVVVGAENILGGPAMPQCVEFLNNKKKKNATYNKIKCAVEWKGEVLRRRWSEKNDVGGESKSAFNT